MEPHFQKPCNNPSPDHSLRFLLIYIGFEMIYQLYYLLMNTFGLAPDYGRHRVYYEALNAIANFVPLGLLIYFAIATKAGTGRVLLWVFAAVKLLVIVNYYVSLLRPHPDFVYFEF